METEIMCKICEDTGVVGYQDFRPEDEVNEWVEKKCVCQFSEIENE